MLALTTDSMGSSGGIAQYNRDFIGALPGADGDFDITILPRIGPSASASAPRIREEIPLASRTIYSLRALMRASARFDIVFCGHLNLAALGAAVAKLSGARFVVQTHGVEAWNCPSALTRSAVERADLVLAVSRYTRARVLSWASIPPERVVVLSNTVDDVFTPGSGGALRKAWGLEGKFILLTAGRLSAHERYKGHDRVVAALPALLWRHPDLVYVVIGEGDDSKRIKSLAVAAGVANRVLFKGAIAREQLVEAYRMADLFVMPSAGEGFGIAFLEAMACGTRAFGLACGGAVDPLCDGEIGIAVPESGFPPALEAAICAGKPDRAALAGAVHARFGRGIFQSRVRQAISACLEGDGPRH